MHNGRQPQKKTWLIINVTFHKDDHMGTRAELELMPADAMTVEPAIQQPFDWQLQQALQQAYDQGGESI
ncbi:MAG: hypothetical protein LKI03_00005 [Acetobacter indonesiensis]|nr:hypothetical protein [Acetobacter indonesiensis]MCI1545340.1 hypothetical protein [Acetobacter indonesiensis]MCI1764416.1 hypothetical protein [Acetobacter indonesiensis]